ncbi:hypothetical protein EAG11_02160 [Flavobacterium sp. 140616W15]|nr:hypothetical protein EAG11_02160 [Flavobacterium sp. 140616W15]
MNLFKIKGSTDSKIYKFVDDYDVNLTKKNFQNGVEDKKETHYVLMNIEDENDIIIVPISKTLLHE